MYLQQHHHMDSSEKVQRKFSPLGIVAKLLPMASRVVGTVVGPIAPPAVHHVGRLDRWLVSKARSWGEHGALVRRGDDIDRLASEPPLVDHPGAEVVRGDAAAGDCQEGQGRTVPSSLDRQIFPMSGVEGTCARDAVKPSVFWSARTPPPVVELLRNLG